MQETTYKNEVVTIKVHGKNKFQGIILNSGTNWTMLKYISVDYVVDGLMFVNNRFITKVSKTEDDLFTEKVLRAKNVDFKTDEIIDLDSNVNLFSSTLFNKNALQIELKRSDVVYIGTITRVNEKSVRCKLIGTKGEDLEDFSYNFDTLRLISLDNDYVNSLVAFRESEYFSEQK